MRERTTLEGLLKDFPLMGWLESEYCSHRNDESDMILSIRSIVYSRTQSRSGVQSCNPLESYRPTDPMFPKSDPDCPPEIDQKSVRPFSGIHGSSTTLKLVTSSFLFIVLMPLLLLAMHLATSS